MPPPQRNHPQPAGDRRGASSWHLAETLPRRLVEHLGKVLVPDLLEPSDALLLADPLPLPHLAHAELALRDAVPGALHHDVEVHAVDAGVGVILDAEVNVLADAKPPVAVLREVAAPELKLLDRQALGDDLLGLVPANSHVARDLLVTADAEAAHSVAGARVDGLLVGELLEHLARTRHAISRFACRDVENQLLNLHLPHAIVGIPHCCLVQSP
mmetsp:Transcript_22424/g.56597  ORF Transcript_22424/g.56597 Transcript_22424/m.56597 type:complete len:214 (-) Transcript_22424:22-663(-)